MKKIGLFSAIFIIAFSLIICGIFYFNSESSSAEESSDNILYNKFYEYTSNEIKFFIKERGYDFVEKYKDEDVQILKKELLVALETKATDFDYLYYEIYETDNMLIRGILYPQDNYYYSNIKIDKMAEFGEVISVKILDDNNQELYQFEMKEG